MVSQPVKWAPTAHCCDWNTTTDHGGRSHCNGSVLQKPDRISTVNRESGGFRLCYHSGIRRSDQNALGQAGQRLYTRRSSRELGIGYLSSGEISANVWPGVPFRLRGSARRAFLEPETLFGTGFASIIPCNKTSLRPNKGQMDREAADVYASS